MDHLVIEFDLRQVTGEVVPSLLDLVDRREFEAQKQKHLAA